MSRRFGPISNDPVLHEFGALCLFAQGDYSRAAAVLNAVLAAAPGMDWTTMSSCIRMWIPTRNSCGSWRRLPSEKPTDAAARFVLAYHYLVVGHTDAAIGELKAVVENQPGDKVAQRMLDALQPKDETPPAAALRRRKRPSQRKRPSRPSREAGRAGRAASRYRSGRHVACRARRRHVRAEGRRECCKFVWKVTPKSGQSCGDLRPVGRHERHVGLGEQGPGHDGGESHSRGADEFQFVISGSPPEDKGLTFKRATK